jgi:CRP-like cAMP-binding protein
MKDNELGRIYADGEVIFKEGDIGNVMYVIHSGKVRITKKTDTGDIMLAILDTGEIFGDMALFDRLPRSATATAMGEARILSIDKKKLFSTISRDPTLVFKTLESMSRRIRKLDEELTGLKKKRIDTLHLSINLDELCGLIMEEARIIISSDNGSIMLFDDDKKSLIIKTAFGAESEPKARFTVGKGIAGDVLRTGRAELVNNVSLDERFIPGAMRVKSVLCAPLRCKGQNFGVINMSNSAEKLFTIDHLKLLHSLAIYASIAIQNALNFSQLKTAADDIILHATMLDMM